MYQRPITPYKVNVGFYGLPNVLCLFTMSLILI
jgi:hypothetical protein